MRMPTARAVGSFVVPKIVTQQMSERPHTLNELKKMESVRNYLLDNGIIDSEGIKDYNNTEK